MPTKGKVDLHNLPDTDDCIDHQQKGNVDGYGHRGKIKLHRYVYELYNGSPAKLVMHTCDNPRCLNPKHLVAGDWGLNNKDRAAKGRSAKSVESRRKITQEQADWVRKVRTTERGSTYSVPNLANILLVDPGTIYNILKGKTHFEDPTA